MRKWVLAFPAFLLVLRSCLGQQPNIVVIVADDMGWNDVGFHGSNQIPTPNLDALAYSGVILNNYYVQPICTPSRAALMTGLYPIHMGLSHDVIYAPQDFGVPLNLTLLPGYLKQVGYSTHLVGKWHLGCSREDYLPTFRGFDSHYGHWTGKNDYYEHTNEEDDGWLGYDMRRDMAADWDAIGKYNTDMFADEVDRVIATHDTSSPLFLYMAHTAVHSANPDNPLQAPQEVIDRLTYIEDEDRRTYAAMMWKMDEAVGRLVQALDSKGMLENSVIMFTSDNGGPAEGYNLNAASNWPMRGVKAAYWDGGYRAAGFIWSTLVSNPGRVSHQMVHITDWLPSFVAAAGGGIQLQEMDGMNLWSQLLDGSESPRTEFLVNIEPIENRAAIRSGDWKLVFNPLGGDPYYGTWLGPSGRNGTAPEEAWENVLQRVLESPAGVAVQNIYPNAYANIESLREDVELNCGSVPADATYVCEDPSAPCLFNIAADPCEYHDVSSDQPEVVSQLLQLLRQYNSTLIAPTNTEWFEAAHPRYWNGTWNNWLDYPMPNTEPPPTT